MKALLTVTGLHDLQLLVSSITTNALYYLLYLNIARLLKKVLSHEGVLAYILKAYILLPCFTIVGYLIRESKPSSKVHRRLGPMSGTNKKTKTFRHPFLIFIAGEKVKNLTSVAFHSIRNQQRIRNLTLSVDDQPTSYQHLIHFRPRNSEIHTGEGAPEIRTRNIC